MKLTKGDNKLKKVSIIVPIYNLDREYLKYCIESILTQDYENLELILINDGSTNGCEVECEQAQEKDSRVVYIDQKNQGVSVARNAGLDVATGEYVIFVDGDDYVTDGILTKLVEKMEADLQLDILLFGYCTNYTNREMVRVANEIDKAVLEKSRLQLAVLQGDPALGVIEVGAPWGKIIRRKVIEDNHVRYTPGLKKGQDTVFILHLLEYCNNIDYLPIAGYHYRISTASVSHRYNTEIIDIMEKTIDAYRYFVAKYDKGTEFEKAVDLKNYKAMTNEYLDLYFINKKNTKKISENIKDYKELITRDRYANSIMSVDVKKLDIFGKLDFFCIKYKMLPLLWIEKKALMFVRSIIVKNYE